MDLSARQSGASDGALIPNDLDEEDGLVPAGASTAAGSATGPSGAAAGVGVGLSSSQSGKGTTGAPGTSTSSQPGRTLSPDKDGAADGGKKSRRGKSRDKDGSSSSAGQ